VRGVFDHGYGRGIADPRDRRQAELGRRLHATPYLVRAWLKRCRNQWSEAPCKAPRPPAEANRRGSPKPDGFGANRMAHRLECQADRSKGIVTLLRRSDTGNTSRSSEIDCAPRFIANSSPNAFPRGITPLSSPKIPLLSEQMRVFPAMASLTLQRDSALTATTELCDRIEDGRREIRSAFDVTDKSIDNWHLAALPDQARFD
jgi:hypothetical protein